MEAGEWVLPPPPLRADWPALSSERHLARVICLQDRLGGLWKWRAGLLFIQEKNQQFGQCMVCTQESVIQQFQLSSDHMPRVVFLVKVRGILAKISSMGASQVAQW